MKNRLLPAAMVALVLTSSSPALSQFLYNKTADDQAKSALEEYRSSRDAHLGIFQKRREALSTQRNQLDDAIARGIRAERDYEIVTLLQQGQKAQRRSLETIITGRLLQITGLSYQDIVSAESAAHPSKIENARRSLLAEAGLGPRDKARMAVPPVNMSSTIKFDEANAQVGLARFPGVFDKLTTGPAGPITLREFCENNVISVASGDIRSAPELVALLAPLQIDRTVDVAFTLVTSCNPIVLEKRAAAAQVQAGGDRALRALAGYALALEKDFPISEAVRLGQDLTKLKAELDAAATEKFNQDALAKQLKNRREELAEAVVSAAKAGTSAQVKGAAAQLAQALNAQANTPPVKACDGQLTIGCARAVAEGLGLVSFDRLRASVAAEIAGYLADPVALAAATKDSCGSQIATDEARRTCLAQAGMATLRVIDTASEVASGRPGELAELAILITNAESRVSDAQARSAALSRQVDNLSAQRKALVIEAILLREAWDALASSTDQRGAILILARSYEDGRLAYQRHADQTQLLRLEGFNDREEQLVRTRYAISDGLLQTVSAGTASGLKPEDAARFLGAIGVTTLGISEATR